MNAQFAAVCTVCGEHRFSSQERAEEWSEEHEHEIGHIERKYCG